MERLPQLGVLAHAVAVAADVDDVAVVKDSVDERRRHDVVAHDPREVKILMRVRSKYSCGFPIFDVGVDPGNV